MSIVNQNDTVLIAHAIDIHDGRAVVRVTVLVPVFGTSAARREACANNTTAICATLTCRGGVRVVAALRIIAAAVATLFPGASLDCRPGEKVPRVSESTLYATSD